MSDTPKTFTITAPSIQCINITDIGNVSIGMKPEQLKEYRSLLKSLYDPSLHDLIDAFTHHKSCLRKYIEFPNLAEKVYKIGKLNIPYSQP